MSSREPHCHGRHSSSAAGTFGFRWFSWTKGDSERHMDILAANALASALTPSPDAASTIRLWAL